MGKLGVAGVHVNKDISLPLPVVPAVLGRPDKILLSKLPMAFRSLQVPAFLQKKLLICTN